MYPWISRTPDFGLQFCEKKCGLYVDVYGSVNLRPKALISALIEDVHCREDTKSFWEFQYKWNMIS